MSALVRGKSWGKRSSCLMDREAKSEGWGASGWSAGHDLEKTAHLRNVKTNVPYA